MGGLPSLKTRHRVADQSCLGARGSLRHDRRAARASCCGPKLTIRVSEGACAVACTAKSDNLPGPGPLDLGAGQVRNWSTGLPHAQAPSPRSCPMVLRHGRQAGSVGLQSICRRLAPSSIVWRRAAWSRRYTRRACTGPGVASGPGVVFCPTAGSRGHRLTAGTPSGSARGPDTATGETARGRWADLQIHCGGVRVSQHVSRSAFGVPENRGARACPDSPRIQIYATMSSAFR